MDNQRRVNWPFAAAVLFLTASVVFALASFTGILLPEPPVYPTTTPRPTNPAATAEPTATPQPTVTTVPAALAPIVVEVASLTGGLDDPITSNLVGALEVAARESPRATEIGILPVEQVSAGSISVVWELTDDDEVRVYVSIPPTSPPLARVDHPPQPWDAPASYQMPFITTPTQDLALIAGLTLAQLEIRLGEDASARIDQLRLDALNTPGVLPANNFAVLDFVHALRLTREGAYTQALQFYSQAIRRDPNFEAALLNRGNIYLILGDQPAAFNAYTSVNAMAGYEQLVLYNRAVADLLAGDTPEVDTLVEQTEGASFAINLRGVAAYQAGGYEAALEAFESLPADSSWVVLLNTARTLDALERPDDALAVYAALVDRLPDDPQIRLYRAFAYLAAEQPAAAAGEFRTAAELDPTAAEPFVQRASIAYERGDYQSALQLAQSALERDPEDGRPYQIIGDIQLLREEWRDARDAYDAAEERGIENAALYTSRAWASQNLRAPFTTVRDYERAVELGANEPVVFYRFGFALHDTGRYEDALEAFAGAINAGFDSPDAVAMLAVCLDANFRRDEAEQTYLEAIQREPRYAELSFLREQPLWSATAIARARSIIQRLGLDGS